MNSTIKLTEQVENKDRKFGSALAYYPAVIVDEDGNKFNALFTAGQIERAVNRAEKNPEDIPGKTTWLTKIFG